MSDDLPTDATHLASTAAYEHQAFAWGRRGLALQCHAEVTAYGLERWSMNHAREIDCTPGLSLGQLRKDAQCYESRKKQRSNTTWGCIHRRGSQW